MRALAMRASSTPLVPLFALLTVSSAVIVACTDSTSPDGGASTFEDAAAALDASPSASDAGAALDATASEDAATDAGTTPLAASDYCEVMAADFCSFYLRCGRVIAADQSSCETYFLAACNEYYEPRYVALETAGLLHLSSTGVDACRAHLASVACTDQIRDLDGPCAAMWEGTSPAEAPCGLDVESFVCAPGTGCALSLNLCGTCRALAAEGDTCGDGVVLCAPGTECSNGQCRARAKVGESCADRSCVLGARCTNDTCAAPDIVGADAACDRDHRCAYGASCVGGHCVVGGAIGEACSASVPCAVGRCVGGTCAPLLEDGATCMTSSECKDGICDSGRCRALPSACFP